MTPKPNKPEPKPPTLDADKCEHHALCVLAALADLSPGERRQVLLLALKLNRPITPKGGTHDLDD